MLRLWFAAAVVVTAFAGPTAQAQAAFPGRAGRIAFTRTEAGDSLVFSIGADGTGGQQLTDAGAGSCCPAWSPDGARIAFFSNREGNDEVYVMNADGTGEENLSHNAAKEGKADWSPDGARIAFSSNRDGDFEVWSMNADGTGALQLTHNTGFSDYNPTWSPDGTKIAFERDPPGPAADREVYVMDATGSNEQDLTQDPAEDGEPEWSPDGSRIAFHSNRGGDFDIWTMSPNGSDLQRLTDDPADDMSPGWSPDGAKIAFSSKRSGQFQVHILDLGSMETTQITAGSGDATTPDWQPLPAKPLSGDTDCSGTITAVDALLVLRAVAGLPVSGCPFAGDADCDGGRDAVDALALLRKVASHPVPAPPAGCPAIGYELPSDPDLAGGALATFTVIDETMRVWVTAPATVQALHDLQWGRTAANIVSGLVRKGPGQGDHNAPWSWHLDPEDTRLVEATMEICDGLPSFVEADVDAWIANSPRFCPGVSELLELVDYTWMTEAGLTAAAVRED